jgi:iron complex outermembrane receptor protein
MPDPIARRLSRGLQLVASLCALAGPPAVARASGSAPGPLQAPAAEAAQPLTVTGVVRGAAGEPLAGASVAVTAQAASEAAAARAGGRGAVVAEALTDAGGAFTLRLAAGACELRVSREGYADHVEHVVVAPGLASLQIALEPLYRLTDAVVVRAVRADATAPVTRTDIGPEALAEGHHGQEMPFLLKPSPSLTYYSDSGLGAGYSYLSLRGIQQTRINMTFDGIPLNDPEESAVYFANFGDFTSALDSIQIQRGVGTSSVGAASFGGSVNFASVHLGNAPELAGEATLGSWSTARGTLGAQSGRLGSGLAFYGRYSYQTTDGYREHSGVSQQTVFYGASRQGERSFFKLFGFSGRERTELAFLAVEEPVLERDRRFNPLSTEEVDRFGQDVVQAQWSRSVGSATTLALQGYYNGAQGWYRLWDDPVARTALLQYAIDGHFVGGIVTLAHARGPLSLTWGAHANTFTRDHWLDIVGGERAYRNTGRKVEASTFLKAGYDLGRVDLFADAQLRYARFRYEGALPLGAVSWTFFNPKLGARYTLRPGLSVYASLGATEREPTRNDLLAGEDEATVPHDLEAVRPERVVDLEAGLEWSGPKLQLQAVAYAMEFRHEIALIGELSDIGLPLRENVERSFRRGLELDLLWRPAATLELRTTANLGWNRIREWTQFYDVYDSDFAFAGQTSRSYGDVRPLLTPSLVLNQSLDWRPARALSLGVLGRYVGESFLDNTNAPALVASLGLSLARWVKRGEPRLRLQATNLLDARRVYPSGYSYLYAVRDAAGREVLSGTPYYYPLATRSVFVTLDLRF